MPQPNDLLRQAANKREYLAVPLPYRPPQEHGAQSLVGTRAGGDVAGLAYGNLFPRDRSDALTVPSVHVDKV